MSLFGWLGKFSSMSERLIILAIGLAKMLIHSLTKMVGHLLPVSTPFFIGSNLFISCYRL